ncbi:PREDICTED: uncharacterized protein At2g39910 isoform X2 [Nelumbo nucifera]|uniref:Uncharacterized protein At2g39910 isoform X2 n=2 Tax=Nelumbo nucifera TaxID=4432 RepID=A0A1U8AKA9_NELNU|nr:PREDICTED: uncharacterized protein At2g39910 isoform X2 [Nelumbo nucifera]DAD28395.1 TPA_asm: hypothetical protein HUJ06_029863 [Nelumbo nucifera]
MAAYNRSNSPFGDREQARESASDAFVPNPICRLELQKEERIQSPCESEMTGNSSVVRQDLIRLSEPIRVSLSEAQYNPPEGANVSIKSVLESLLPNKVTSSNLETTEEEIRREIRDFCLCCAALTSAQVESGDLLSWIPRQLSAAAKATVEQLSRDYFRDLDENKLGRIREIGVDFASVPDERKLVVELMPEVIPLLKGTIKESSIDATDDGDEIYAASARTPVAYAIIAAYQFRWFVTQVDYPHLGKLCALVIPCALTALDHWSPEVKGQGMISIIHLVKNVNAAELGVYEDVILDLCCRNIAFGDEIWHLVVEMSVLLVTRTQRRNPRSPWFERMLNEMLSHLERQPRNKERSTAWLQLIEPVLDDMGLVLLAHFRRIFPLLFQWMHSDDDELVLLVLQRIYTIIKLTWIRNTPYVERLVDELTVTYKEAALRRGREVIRTHIVQILILLQQCKGLQFEEAWKKHRDDPNLTSLTAFLGLGITDPAAVKKCASISQ